MKLTTTLLGGLVRKPPRNKPTSKENRRKDMKRVRAIEEFLSRYPLRKWNGSKDYEKKVTYNYLSTQNIKTSKSE